MSMVIRSSFVALFFLVLSTKYVVASIQVFPTEYQSNWTPGGNSWYVDNGYSGSTVGGLSGGVGELIDGVKGTSITSGYSQWAPYSLIDVGGGSAEITYIYHFDQRYAWESIVQYQYIYHNAAVNQPTSFEVSFSIDGGITYHSSVIRSMSDAENSLIRGTAEYSLLGAATGYHADAIRIVLNQPRRWSATDEVEFVALSVVPEPCSFAMLAGVFSITCAAFFRRRGL
ncbi:hypothetical protein QEH52_00800 [Coraliomargarita sp. SDUM461003]|uniref:PEP-CTERM protein-sorting domain-containing protein n=1 Tax=Thalassobacterium maritimum TaxID=3041265 RepID=A0ABU1APE0_9BACT|nr:hypothetical protein [Coraliomargarita sp. SDUM461003]MDQ8206033.1 hypothetical protein [Coraliomargarita sp. SDUM461003]